VRAAVKRKIARVSTFRALCAARRYFVGSRSAVKPMPRRFVAGGFMSLRIAERKAVIASS
jgi:hypothetical protein